MADNSRRVKVLDFDINRCRNCFKCIRNCEVKAINIRDHHVQIDEDQCIMCGKCLQACAINARFYCGDIGKVKNFIKNGERVILSVSPAWMGVMAPCTEGQYVAALKALGFDTVRETAEGAVYVTREYQKLLNEGRMTNIITSHCPSAIEMIEKDYPELVPYIAPVVSPTVAHGKLLRKLYGYDVRLVYLGGCIARKDECWNDERNAGLFDAVITFGEVKNWFKQKGIDPLKIEEEAPFDNPCPQVNRLYAVRGGIINSVMADNNEEHYLKFYVHGMDDTKDLLDTMSKGHIKDSFVEIKLCRGSCVHGSAPGSLPEMSYGLKIYYNKKIPKIPADPSDFAEKDLDLSQTFYSHKVKEPVPSQQEIEAVLRKTGMFSRRDELNCGACGYNTCRERAVAVVRGKTELNMCVHYMRERTESFSNLILDFTPDIIILTDHDMRIHEFNKRAEEVFGISRAHACECFLYDLIPSEDFEYVAETGIGIYGQKVEYEKYHVVTQQTIVYMETQDMILGLFRNITQIEAKRRQNAKVKAETLEIAQNVIERQMSAAQMIAGLLGETTADTKVTLNKLRNMIMDED